MMTWLDWQSPVTVRRALGSVADRGQAADRRFDLWLALVDLHLEELGSGRTGLVWEWRRAYADGWSPRTAAFAAWANNVQPVDPTGEED
jgi:hypothetical protein